MLDFLTIMKAHGYYQDARWNRSDFKYTFESGSIIEFFGVEQPKKVHGPRRDRLFINECNNVSFQVFEQLEVRTRQTIFLDWNPTNEFWFYTDVMGKRDDVDHVILTYKDNEGLESSIVASIEQRRTRKGWWKVYGEGQLGEVEGKIYRDWQPIDEIPHEAKLVRGGQDFGYSSDPAAAVNVYGWNGALIIDEVMFQKGLQNKQIADIWLNVEDRTLIIGDSSEPKSIDEIYSYGVQIIGATKGRDSVRFGIQVVQGKRIFVTRRSVNVWKEYRNYLWETDRNGKVLTTPEHEWSHSMDAIRYAIASLEPDPLKVEPEYEQQPYEPTSEYERSGFSQDNDSMHAV